MNSADPGISMRQLALVQLATLVREARLRARQAGGTAVFGLSARATIHDLRRFGEAVGMAVNCTRPKFRTKAAAAEYLIAHTDDMGYVLVPSANTGETK